jgi:hypothetical protein
MTYKPNYDRTDWRRATTRETGQIYPPSRRPYTEAAWAEFTECTNLNT